MTKEELKQHCEKQVRMCEEWAKGNDREPSGKIYEEHKLILDLINALEQQTTVTPTHGTCKDCRHWKDSDGVYRRGISAESKCPINNSRVFEGTFYCADYEKRGDEE